ncbi:MAG: DUF2155 domain-containing protein [Rickettsiaceae bacterium]
MSIILFVISVSFHCQAEIPVIDTIYNDNNSQYFNNSLIKHQHARLIILNKITAKSFEQLLTIGRKQYIGNLSIEVHACIKNIDPFDRNNLISLTVIDNKIEDENILIFQGWLVSSDPSLSTIEHPVYEIIAQDCLTY